MSRSIKRRWGLLVALIGTGTLLALTIGLGVFAGAGAAASSAAPANTDPPTISGTPQEGQTLVGHRGQWNGSPTDYNDYWVRCNKNGGSCANISGATNKNGYLLTNVDVGNTIRFKVRAQNSGGNTFASSVPTAVITVPVEAGTCGPGARPARARSRSRP